MWILGQIQDYQPPQLAKHQKRNVGYGRIHCSVSQVHKKWWSLEVRLNESHLTRTVHFLLWIPVEELALPMALLVIARCALAGCCGCQLQMNCRWCTATVRFSILKLLINICEHIVNSFLTAIVIATNYISF